MSQRDLEAELRLLWGAYLYLKEQNLSEVSSTSRLLHERNRGYFLARLQDELRELAGVLTGEHRHTGLQHDVVLEGSQVCYWLYLATIDTGFTYDELQPHLWLSSILEPAATTGGLALGLHEVSSQMRGAEAGQLLSLLQLVLSLVGTVVWLAQLEAREVVKYDLEQMATKLYLADYFAGVSNSGSG